MLFFEVCLPLRKTAVNYFDWNTWIHFRKLWSLLNVPKSSKNTNYFGFFPSFCFRIIASKKLIFEIWLPLKEPLVVTFGKMRAHTSRKCVVVQGINLIKIIQKIQISLVALTHFCFRIIASKCSFFEDFLPVREPLVATFKKTHSVTSPKDIVKQDLKIWKA